jgi:hypothetical protein
MHRSLAASKIHDLCPVAMIAFHVEMARRQIAAGNGRVPERNAHDERKLQRLFQGKKSLLT